MRSRFLTICGGVAFGVVACGPPAPVEPVPSPFDPVGQNVVQTVPLDQSLPAPGTESVISDETIAAPLEAPGTETSVNAGGLVERLPNTCKLENYRQYLGQSGLAAQSGVTDRPFRVIEPDGIVTQEYNPQRVNFYLDGAGIVTRVICG